MNESPIIFFFFLGNQGHFAGQAHPPPPPSLRPGFGRPQQQAGNTQSPWNFGPSGSYQAI